MAPSETLADGQRPHPPERAPSYRPWAELLARTFAVGVLDCPKCHGRMRLFAMVQDPANIAHLLAAVGEPTEGAPPLAGARSSVLEEPRAVTEARRRAKSEQRRRARKRKRAMAGALDFVRGAMRALRC